MREPREFKADDRGVSEVIGAILVFGLAITLMATLQMYAIPSANEEVEFNHNQDVQEDFVDYLEASSRTASQGSTESVGLQMGATYPTRLLFFNPPNPSGEIRTVDGTVVIDNAVARDPIIRQKNLNGDTKELDAKRIQYEPQYNEYRNPPTTSIEYGVQYNDFGDRRLIQNEGNVVSGNNIDLMFFGGDLSRTSSSALSLNARPMSAPARTVSITADDGPITITLPSNIPKEDWEEILSEEMVDEGGNINEIKDHEDGVQIVLRESRTYTLRTPVIGLGSNVEQPEAAYLYHEEGTTTTAPLGDVHTLELEVRDEYNNPVRDETVDVHLADDIGGEIINNDEITTNSEGIARVRYEAPAIGEASVGDIERLRATYEGDASDPSFDPTETQNLEVDIIHTDRDVPTGGPVDATIEGVNPNCNTDLSGLFDLFDLDQIAEFDPITWSADVDGDETPRSATIQVVDTRNGQIASQTSFKLNEEVDHRETYLFDQRYEDGSCGADYNVELTVTSTGGMVDTDNTTVSV